MANIPTLLQALLAASSIFSLVPLLLLLILAILTTLFFSVVALRLIPSAREVAELADKNATLQCEFDACKKALDALAEESDRAPVPNAKTSPDAQEPSPQSSPPAPAVDSEVESERVRALEARLDFLRDSCKIMMTQKNDLLAQKDGLLTQQNADLAVLKAQLAATRQTKDELLTEKDASCRTILAQKNEELTARNDELAALKAHLATVHHAIVTVTTERDEAVARAATIADELEKTRADYDDKIASLTTRIVDAETSTASLQTLAQQQESKISGILLKNNSLNMEIVMLAKRLETSSRQRTTPSSPRYSFHSFISPRSSESESDSSFDFDRPSPPRWRRFTIRRARKSGKP